MTIVLAGIIVGWLLKSIADYASARVANSRILNQAIFHILRTWKHLKDYDRGTEYFRKNRPSIEEFEPWRAILAKRLQVNVEASQKSADEAAKTLAQADPAFATELDNSLRRVVFSLNSIKFNEIAESDPERYAQLVYNQDKLIDLAMHEFKQAACKLAKRVSILQQFRVRSYFTNVENGTKEYMQFMEEQSEMLKKVVAL